MIRSGPREGGLQAVDQRDLRFLDSLPRHVGREPLDAVDLRDVDEPTRARRPFEREGVARPRWPGRGRLQQPRRSRPCHAFWRDLAQRDRLLVVGRRVPGFLARTRVGLPPGPLRRARTRPSGSSRRRRPSSPRTGPPGWARSTSRSDCDVDRRADSPGPPGARRNRRMPALRRPDDRPTPRRVAEPAQHPMTGGG